MSLKSQPVDLATWNRRDHFAFFNDFYDPTYGITCRVDYTKAYKFCKENGFSLFQSSLYWTLKAAQTVEAFHLRIEDKLPIRYERVDAGSAIDRPDGTFGFGYFPYDEDMNAFLKASQIEVERVRKTTGLCRTESSNVIRYSSVPWIDFTSITHAQKFETADSSPRITFGKMAESGGSRSMPVGIHVHHALVDGRDIGAFVEAYQALLADPTL